VAELAAVRAFGLRRSAAVLEGTFSAATRVGEEWFAPFHVETVRYGLSFLAGMDVAVPFPEAPEASLAGSRQVLGLSGSYPSDWGRTELPVWSNLLTMVPEAELSGYASQLGYRSDLTSHVAVVRIVAQDGYRTTFEVLDALRGTFPGTFQDNWYASWGLPWPGVSEEVWIASVSGLTEYPPDGDLVGTVIDLRPASPEALAEVKAALATPSDPFAAGGLRALRDEYRTGFLFHTSEVVVSSLVTGLAEECCTGAGGTYVSNEVSEVFRGDAVPGRFVIGGHAYYGDEDCGDAHLAGLAGIVDPVALAEDDFDCLEYPLTDMWEAWVPLESPVRVRLPFSPAARDAVAGWVKAAPPVYRLHQPDSVIDPDEVAQDGDIAPWSMPLDPLAALMVASRFVLFTVQEVSYDAGTELHTVLVSTTFSTAEYEHLEVHEAKLVFHCGDPRLLQEGARWVGGLVMLDDWSYGGEPPDLARTFLVPGALLPEAAMTPQIENAMALFLNGP